MRLSRAGVDQHHADPQRASRAFAADGYARVTGQPGVVCTTAGPGATNALTGVAEGWADSVPVLLLAGQVNCDALDRECGNYHEIDLEAIFRPVTKWCGTVRRHEHIPGLSGPGVSGDDVGTAAAGRAVSASGPDAGSLHRARSRSPAFPEPPEPAVPADAIARAAETSDSPPSARSSWRAAVPSGPERPPRSRHSPAQLGAPVITTLNGKGLLDERDPLSLGHARSARGRHALPHADAMLAVGCRFTEVHDRLAAHAGPRDARSRSTSTPTRSA